MLIVIELLVSALVHQLLCLPVQLQAHRPVYVARNKRLQKVRVRVYTRANYTLVCAPACAERLSARRSLEVQEAIDVVRQKETQLSRLQSSLVRMEVDARTRSRSPSPERQIVHVSQVRRNVNVVSI